jgi:hypothetical protein
MKEFVNNNRFVIVAVLLLVLGVIVFFSRGTQTGPARERDFRLERGQYVTRLELHAPDGEGVRLERTRQGWQLNGQTPANQPAIDDLLATLRNLIVRFPAPLAERSEVINEMATDGIRVQVFARRYWIPLPGNRGLLPGQRRVKSFDVGSDTPDGQSTYMLMQGAQTPYVLQVPGLAGGLREVFLPYEHLWRDPVVIHLEADRIRRVHALWPQQPHESFVLHHRGHGQVDLATLDGQEKRDDQIEPGRVQRFLESFTDLYYEQMVTGPAEALRDSLMFEQPFMMLELEDQDGKVNKVTFFRRLPPDGTAMPAPGRDFDPNRFYIRLDEDQYAIGQYFVFNRVMRPLSFFLVEPR